MHDDWKTPFEQGNGNQTTTWEDCIAFHERLARHFPSVLRFGPAGDTDSGVALHVGVLSADGVFDPEAIKAAGRPVFFNNNGIHPGEPEGVDACMALVRDMCVHPEKRAALGNTVLVYIPIYNVDGSLNRNNSSRVNQVGPESFGFRGNARHLDLNRDFTKCDTRNARSFNRIFTTWDPDVMVDTHTSNGADYAYTMTLIHTQHDQLGGALGEHLRERMLPALYAGMNQRGWPTCPYVNTRKDIPDDGIEDFLDTPRYSTGYASLHHTVGFMPETHMLKSFADRYHSMRALLDTVLAYTVAHGVELRRLRAQDRAQVARNAVFALTHTLDDSRPTTFRFKGYAARYTPSRLGNYTRLSYDRSAPFEKDIPYFNRYLPAITVKPPQAYLVPQAWTEVIERLRLNHVHMRTVARSTKVTAEAYRVDAFEKRGPYEGHHIHTSLTLSTHRVTLEARAGDVVVPVAQDRARYLMHVLEPLGADSFFRWGMLDSVLEKKERFSDYVFEDEAEQLLKDEPDLKAAFDAWKAAHPALLSNQDAVLGFIFAHCRRYAEPEHRRYPIFRLLPGDALP